jgi:hypothetical protein
MEAHTKNLMQEKMLFVLISECLYNVYKSLDCNRVSDSLPLFPNLIHSEIPTAVGSGEAAQMLSAGVGVQKRRKTAIHNHRISFKFPEIMRAIRSDRSCEGNIPSGKSKVKSRHNQNHLFGRTRGNDRAPSGEAR